ncbi:MAG: hypothetical protein ACLP7Q_22020 [Isosphaeraceae bacterium]
MTFSLECRACGHSNRVDSSLVGKRVKCQGCGAAIAVSAPPESSDSPSGSSTRLKFNCPACGKEFATKPELAGKKVRCSGCQKVVLVPAAAVAPAERAPQGPVRTDRESAKAESSPRPASQPDRNRERGRNSDRATPAPVLPEPEKSGPEALALRGDLRAFVQKGAEEHVEQVESVLPPRSQLMEHVRRKAAAEAGEDPALARALASAKKRKGKTKRKGHLDPKDTLRLLGGILGVVLVVSFVAWGYPYFRLPFALILLVLGFVTYFMGIVSLQELIADKPPLTLMLYRIFPPFQWLIMVSRWAEAKGFAPFFVVGAIIMGLGGGFIATAPSGRQADKPAKTVVRRKGPPLAQPNAPPPATKPEEQKKPAASTPKAEAPPPAGRPKEQTKPTGPAPASAKEQAKPTGPAPASAKEQVKPTGPAPASAPAPLSTPAQSQPKPPTQQPSGSSKPADWR